MKYRFIRSMLMVLLSACLIAALLSGCNQVNDPSDPSASATTADTSKQEEPITLRILVEDDLGGTMEAAANDMLHMYLSRWVRDFSMSHENMEIVIEEIPKTDGREETLQRLRTELMLGEGPDMLLLPSSPTQYYALSNYLEPLIPDVQQAMRNGLFLDIGAYYDADAELNRDALHQTVMDAGVLDGARYVLPLSYDLPVAYVAKEAFAQSGAPQDIFAYGATDLLNAAAKMEDLGIAASFYQSYANGAPMIFNFFPQLIDYETGEVTVTAEELESYLRAWQSWRDHMGKVSAEGQLLSYTRDLFVYCLGDTTPYWAEEGLFASCDSMLRAADNVILARTYGVELDMYPMRAIDGSVVADVSLYAAVSSGCEHPELAYEFLRHFLSEEFQWQTGDVISDLDFYGWPVRIEGSTAAVCAVELDFAGSDPLNGENVTDAEMPILNAQIDHVRFPIPLETEFAEAVTGLYDVRNKQAVETDLGQMAADWIKKLQVHADEG